MPFPLTLIADDYGLSPGVSRGIREALAAGRLSGTGCMVNLPLWPEEAAALNALAGRAQIGLHLNLTAGSPLVAMPVLAPSGILPGIAALVKASRRGQLPQREIQSEIAAQLDAFTAHFRRMPDFLDGHQHVQILPGITGPLLAELHARQLGGKLWQRNSTDHPARILARRSHLLKATGIAWLGRHFARQARAAGFAVNDGFAGYSAFDPRGNYAQDFARYLIAPGKSHLIMCHPGYIDAELRAADPVTETRALELRFLLSKEFLEVLQRAGAMLATGNAGK